MAAKIYTVYDENDVLHAHEPIYWNAQDLSVTYLGKTYTRIFEYYDERVEVDKVALRQYIGGHLPRYYRLLSPNSEDERMLLRFYCRGPWSEGISEISRVWRK